MRRGHFISNLRTLASDKIVAKDFCLYCASHLLTGGYPYRKMPGGARITGFSRFSEYHAVGDFLSPEERQLLPQLRLPPGDVIDVGANLGVVSLFLAQHMPQRTIHAFEPNPSTFDALEGNLKLNKCTNVCANQKAVSDLEGELLFNADPIARGTASIARSASAHVTKVLSTTLDAYAAEHRLDRIALLKLDVEGYEASVIRGGRSLIGGGRADVILYEVSPSHAERAGFSPAEATSLLRDQGYRTYRLLPGGGHEETVASDAYSVASENWIAARAEIAQITAGSKAS